ncbi:MAG: hypothetical protein K2Y26_18415, partial [Gemmatimonadaceae bacterium]|nr:hypothetical protein [Gemmatimonadaceae bacterium]
MKRRQLWYAVAALQLLGAVKLAAQTSTGPMDLTGVLTRPEVQRALSALDAATPAMAQGLAALGAIESPSGGEQQRAAEVARRMRAMGLADVRMDAQPNVIGRIPGTSGRAIVFVSTLDDLAS